MSRECESIKKYLVAYGTLNFGHEKLLHHSDLMIGLHFILFMEQRRCRSTEQVRVNKRYEK